MTFAVAMDVWGLTRKELMCIARLCGLATCC